MTVPRVVVGVGQAAVRRGPGEIVTLGLGSCVAIVLHDPGRQVGGLAHVLLPLPGPSGPGDRPARYAATAPAVLLEQLEAAGADRAAIRARLVGGASMFMALSPPGSVQVGERNIVAAREALRGAGLPLVGEATGGGHGRNVALDLSTGRVLVTSYAHEPEEL